MLLNKKEEIWNWPRISPDQRQFDRSYTCQDKDGPGDSTLLQGLICFKFVATKCRQNDFKPVSIF